MSAVKQVIAAVLIGNIHIVVVIPAITPIGRPWVENVQPITLVLESRISGFYHERQAANSEPVILSKVSSETVFRNPISVISATLFPTAVIRLPVAGTMVLPYALFFASLLLGALRLSIAAILSRVLLLRALLLLGVLLPAVLLLGTLLLGTLLLSVLLLLGSLFLPRLLGTLLFLNMLRLRLGLSMRLLLGMILLFFRMLLHCKRSGSGSKKRGKKYHTCDLARFHVCHLQDCWKMRNV